MTRSWRGRGARFILTAAAVLSLCLALFPIPTFASPPSVISPIPSQVELVLNPYEHVNWHETGHYKGNLHTHTTKSDGRMSAAQVIDSYKALGYTILSITDHDNMGSTPLPTWPWEAYGRNPEHLGMLAVQGNELSYHNHLGSYFSDTSGRPRGSVAENLEAIGAAGGLAIFFHPGRYHSPEAWTWYAPYYLQHPRLVGLEVYNQGDRYPRDRELWDYLLKALMPHRPVWGFSNDDMHLASQIGKNFNSFLLEDLSKEELKAAMIEGRFYFSHQPGSSPAPVIRDIRADGEAITIRAEHHTEVYWISMGEEIHRGGTLFYQDTPGLGSYVRAVVVGEGGRTYINPFGFTTPPSELLLPAALLQEGAAAEAPGGDGASRQEHYPLHTRVSGGHPILYRASAALFFLFIPASALICWRWILRRKNA